MTAHQLSITPTRRDLRQRNCVLCDRRLRVGSLMVYGDLGGNYGVHKSCAAESRRLYRDAKGRNVRTAE